MRVTLRFPTIIPGVPTAGAGHIYSPAVLASVLDQICKRLPWQGCLDHPEDGRTRVANISHQTLSISQDGYDISGEVEILDTSCGRLLQTFIAAGYPLLLSPLMLGSREPDGTLGPDVRVAALNIVIPDNEMATSTLDFIIRAISLDGP